MEPQEIEVSDTLLEDTRVLVRSVKQELTKLQKMIDEDNRQRRSTMISYKSMFDGLLREHKLKQKKAQEAFLRDLDEETDRLHAHLSKQMELGPMRALNVEFPRDLKEKLERQVGQLEGKYAIVEQQVNLMKQSSIEFIAGGKKFSEPAKFLMEHRGGPNGIGRELLELIAMNQHSTDLPWLHRSQRGFEAMIDYLKTQGKYKPIDPEIKQLMEIELEHFGISKFDEKPRNNQFVAREEEKKAKEHEWQRMNKEKKQVASWRCQTKQVQVVLKSKLEEMWKSTDDFKNDRSILEKFTIMGPRSVNSVTKHLDNDFLSFDEAVYEYREEKDKQGRVIKKGQFNKMEGCFEGVMRKLEYHDNGAVGKVTDCIQIEGIQYLERIIYCNGDFSMDSLLKTSEGCYKIRVDLFSDVNWSKDDIDPWFDIHRVFKLK